jgi:hypothetical protein
MNDSYVVDTNEESIKIKIIELPLEIFYSMSYIYLSNVIIICLVN